MLKLKARKNLILLVTDRQEEILQGSLLGDAYITKRGQIQFEQSENQKEYLFWKHEVLQTISYKNIVTVSRFDKRFAKTYISYRFWTRQYFLDWRTRWYVNGRKIIPRDIQFTPLVLAVWYMDDGCYSDHKCIISTDNFVLEDILFIQNLLFKTYGLKTSIKNKTKILIRKESQNNFFQLIKPYIISNLRYKILDPVTTSAISRDTNFI